MKTNNCKRDCIGITLVEVIVVVAIILLLLACILPAIQRVRELSNRVLCASQIRQITIACHNFEVDVGRLPYNTQHYPSGWRIWEYQKEAQSWSWLARILPYLEQDYLFRKTAGSSLSFSRCETYLSTQIPILLCPSDESAISGPSIDRQNLEGALIGLTSYKGVSGSNWHVGQFVNQGTNGFKNGLKHGDGIFFRDDWKRSLKLSHILDGTSNTFIIGEDIPGLNTHCSWPYANNANGTCAIPPNHGNIDGVLDKTNWQELYSFRSRHPLGVQFATADASVHFVKNTIATSLYKSLSTINGGEPVSLEDIK